MFAVEIAERIRLFLVGSETYYRLLVVRYPEVDSFCRVHRGGDGPENVADLSLNLIHIDVADHDDCLEIRTVPLFVVGAKEVIFEIVDYFHRADRHTVAVAVAVRIDDRKALFQDSDLGIGTGSPLLMDHSALAVDVLVGKEKAIGPVMENPQAGIDGGRNLSNRYIVDVVDCLINAGVGIEVLTELDTDALAVLDEGIAREMLSSVEAHVLEEVGEAPLVLFFQDGTDLLGDVEVRLACRLAVFPDIIGKSVLELADLHRRIDRYRLALLSE